MLILKRLAMWSGETLCEALLITLFLAVLWTGKGQSSLRDDIGVIFMGTAFVFMVGSGDSGREIRDRTGDSGQTAMSPLHRARAFGFWMNYVGSALHKFSTGQPRHGSGVA